MLTLVLVVAAWKLGAHSQQRNEPGALPKSTASEHVIRAQPGPWGDLEFTRITIEVPDHFITINPPEPSRWFFKDQSRQQLIEFFQSAGLSSEQLELLKKSEWKTEDGNCWIVPPNQLIAGLSLEARRKVYSVLSLSPENPDQNGAFRFRPERLEERFVKSGLEEKTINFFKSLLYSQNSLLFFADCDLVLSSLKNDQEKMRFIKTITRRTSLLMTLHVNRDSDIEGLLKYWGRGGRAKDLRPILESLTRIPGGGSIDISHLLPPFVRQRIYTYPEPAIDAMASKESCHWSSLNFFNLTPDPRFSEPEFANGVIEKEYLQTDRPSELGDLIFIQNSQGMGIHSAIYIADNIVFTKNGTGFNQPWIYMQMEDMLPIYLEPNDSMRIVTYRRKNFSYSAQTANLD